MTLEGKLVYHHGKFEDAKNIEYQEGSMWRLEPVWNTTVTLLDPLPASWRRKGWSDSFLAIAHTYVIEDDRPHCDGQVLDSYEEALAACEDLSWIPARFHEIAEAEFKREFRREESSQGSTALGNGTVDDDGGYTQCWVERTDHTHVYLDVAEPLKVYGDLLAVLVLVAVALIFAVCIAREHRSSVIEWIHRVRNPFDAGVGPAEPGVVGDDKTRTQLNSYQQRRAGRASKEFNQWSSELHTMTREMV